ncbi:MAG: glycosyltransferase [Bacteroides sp.]
MRLLINASGNLQGGGLQVAYSFISECVSFGENEYHIVCSDRLHNLFIDCAFPSNFFIYKINQASFLTIGRVLSQIELKVKPDIVFSIFGPVYWRPKHRHVMGFAQGYYIYFDSPFWKQISFLRRLTIYIKKIIHFFYLRRDADVFITETVDATNRLKKIIPNKQYYTVSNTFGKHFYSYIPSDKYLLETKIGMFKLVSICGFYKHKNLLILKKVVDVLKSRGYDNILFYLTIKEADYNLYFEERYHCNIKTLGTIKPTECPQVYFESDAVIVPSLLECFTANYPEAMIMEKPILTSDLSFAKSICGNAALYFDPLDAEDIANSIIKIVLNKDLVQLLIDKGKDKINSFPSARERAEQYLDILKRNI